MIDVLIGNLFESNAQTLVNTVNCVGVMGKGIAAEFKKCYPTMFRQYKQMCDAGNVKLGYPYPYTDLTGIPVVNFPTKQHWRANSRLQDIVDGLDHFVNHYVEWGIKSIAFPPLGCGNGGLLWIDVGRIMYDKLSILPIPIEIYAPYGTPSSQLKPSFLQQRTLLSEAVGIRPEKLKDEWLTIIEVVYQLSLQPYARPVGRTTFQKISYILTELGVATGLTFGKGSYGPFSADLKAAITTLANANLLYEKSLGRMTQIVIGDEYKRRRRQFQPRIAPFQDHIDKAVDLFSRIKSTAQAEEVTTVSYATKTLKQKREAHSVSEQDVFDYIMNWKKSWRDEAKQANVASTIRNLQMLNWIQLQYSPSLADDAWNELD